MVIDFHTHAFPDKIYERAIASLVANSARDKLLPHHSGSLSGLLDSMDRFGVDMSVVQPVVTSPRQTKTINEWAAEITDGKTIISFGGLHPHTDDYKRDIDFICSLGLRGIKLHCEYQDFKVDDPFMLKIYDYAFSKGLIILQHAGYDPAFDAPFRSNPEMFARVMREMKGGIMIAAHFGGMRQWDEVERHLVGTDIYIDTSMGQKYYSSEQFLRIVKNHGADKILFGSDSPWSNAGEELDSIRSSALTAEQKEWILHKTAEKLLNL